MGRFMTNKISLSIFTAGLLAATVLLAPCAPAVAQERQERQERVAASSEFSAQQQEGEKKKAAPQRAAPHAAPQRAAPRVAPQRATQQRAAPQRAAPRVAAPRRAQPRVAAPQKLAPHVAAPRTVARPQATPRVVRQPKSSPKVAAPAATARKTASPAVAPRTVTPHGTRAVTASRLRGMPVRGAGRTAIHGHNYSVWRSGYRVRHGSGWRTFVALSTLGAILIDSNEYYPYAYISAPENYCEGLTEDGCDLQWQEVQTEEGDVFDQCVAYCPWQ
jgi:hypothetical protein